MNEAPNEAKSEAEDKKEQEKGDNNEQASPHSIHKISKSNKDSRKIANVLRRVVLSKGQKAMIKMLQIAMLCQET